MDDIESLTEKEMKELCRNADRVIEELQKTDAAKATDCSASTERLKVLCPVISDADLLRPWHDVCRQSDIIFLFLTIRQTLAKLAQRQLGRSTCISEVWS